MFGNRRLLAEAFQVGRKGRISRKEMNSEVPGSDERPSMQGAWYLDPHGAAGERWWDGQKWTQEVRGTPNPDTATTTPHRARVGGYPITSDVPERMAGISGSSQECPNCRGTGRSLAWGYTCPNCLGKGRATRTERRVYWSMFAITIAILTASILLHWH